LTESRLNCTKKRLPHDQNRKYDQEDDKYLHFYAFNFILQWIVHLKTLIFDPILWNKERDSLWFWCFYDLCHRIIWWIIHGLIYQCDHRVSIYSHICRDWLTLTSIPSALVVE
jgi:hypothetical protein